MHSEPIDQFRRRCKESAEKWALFKPEEKVMVCEDIKNGYPANLTEYSKIETQLSRYVTGNDIKKGRV